MRGELSRLGFDCVACKKDPELNERRGCGKPPIDFHGNLWLPDKWLVDELERNQGVMPEGSAASGHYTWANIGDALSNTGSLWPWCPAWYARFYDGPETVRADAAIEMAGFVRRKMLPLVVDRPQSAVQVNEVVRAMNISDMLRNQAEERRLSEMRSKTPTKARR